MTDLTTFSPDHPLILAGCGNMGGALLDGWLAAGLRPDAVYIVDPQLARQGSGRSGIRCVTEPGDLPAALQPGMLMLAVKPQLMADVVPDYVPLVQQAGASVVSIAAGIGMASYESWFGSHTPIVRVMPNTPAAVGQGLSLLLRNNVVDAELAALSEVMLSAVGPCLWVERESQIDALVGVTGSGPAYVFLLMECMATAVERAGLSPEQAQMAARQTILGAAILADRQAGIDPGELRRRVTSPGGVTQAALDVLMDEKRGLTALFPEAMEAGERRNAALSGES
ncbi:MAG: pyrroline-5-carboxylate reductase [Kiloniella sp.]|nr:pyrroline-5-carboxylate reductase [Kiloniella sp.]RZO30499.1 MAG: pyrroline-5-carboxylate reductase [Rhodospirillaceae bacterium]